MKKTKLTALACAAALAMSMPAAAFAADPVPAVTGSASVGSMGAAYEDASGATTGPGTTINVTTYVSHINVTVPLSFSMALDTAGNEEAIVPDDNAYKIVNNSTVPVVIKSAVVAPEAAANIGIPAAAGGSTAGALGSITSGNITPVKSADVNVGAVTALPIKETADDGLTLGWQIAAATGATETHAFKSGITVANIRTYYSSTKPAIRTAIDALDDQSAENVYQAVVSNGGDASIHFDTTTSAAGAKELGFKINAKNTALKGSALAQAEAAVAKVTYVIAASTVDFAPDAA